MIFARNDGNLTHLEILLGHGEVNRILKVLVNDIDVAEGVAGRDMTASGWYNVITAGGRQGGFNLQFTDGSGQPLGDPYGSMAVLTAAVPNRIADGRTIPDVRVLLEGLKLDTFDLGGTFAGRQFSSNPAWVLMDLLLRSGWTHDELDTASFARSAAYCAEGIAGFDAFGAPTLIPRFQTNLFVRRRRSVSDWVRGIGEAARLFLTYTDEGLLELRTEGTFATQHPSKPPGSNSSSPLFGGWAGYEFGDGTGGISGIARRSNGASSFRVWSRETGDTPNRISLEFQDEFNQYQQDSLSLVDVEDAQAVRQEITVTSPALGIPNFHQAARQLKLYLDRAVRGNTYVSFDSSVRAVGLRPGDLITVTHSSHGFDRTPFRITRLLPGLNHSTTSIEAQVHDETWYSDEAAPAGGNAISGATLNSGAGLPRPLIGAEVSGTGTSLGITEFEEITGDGGTAVWIEAAFHAPKKPTLFGLEAPRLSSSAYVADTGGSISGGQTLYYGVTALDSDQRESSLSFVVKVTVPATGDTNRVSLHSIAAAPTAVAMNVYRGPTPATLLRIAHDAPMAAVFEDSGLQEEAYGPPDPNYDRALIEWRLEFQPEAEADIAGLSSIGSSTLQMLPDEYTGMNVRIIAGTGAGQERTVLGNTADTVTVDGPWRVQPDATSTFVIAEANWRAGATALTSPGRFICPNRPGATLQIAGLAANAQGRHSGYESAPVTRWQIGGGEGGTDSDVPPAPMFGLTRTGRGGVEVGGISFATFENTATVTSATLRLHFWSELNASPSTTLSAELAPPSVQLQLSTDAGLSTGSLLRLGAEIVEIESVDGTGLVANVLRGAFDTSVLNHPAGTSVYLLESKTFVIPFLKGFFGSPASGSFSFPVLLPDVRISCAEMVAANARGNSETRRLAFTALSDNGIRTLSGGEATLQVDGPLAIQTGAAPPLVVDRSRAVGDVFAVVGEAPNGSPVILQLRQNSEVLCTLTIAAGSTISNIMNGADLPPLTELSRLHLDVTSVSPSALDSPGRDLTVVVRF
ncbi:MAG: phage tail protein [Bryobacteraceae bacterium]